MLQATAPIQPSQAQVIRRSLNLEVVLRNGDKAPRNCTTQQATKPQPEGESSDFL
jgi:hypothetical protein